MTSYQTIPIKEVSTHLGDNICVYYPSQKTANEFTSPGSCGQGGFLLKYDDDSLTLVNPLGTEIRFEYGDIDHIALEDEEGNVIPVDPCLDQNEDCSGPVRFWYSGGMNGRSWPRCTHHGRKRLADYESSLEKYADSDVPPGWFDPSYAGERWEEDY